MDNSVLCNNRYRFRLFSTVRIDVVSLVYNVYLVIYFLKLLQAERLDSAGFQFAVVRGPSCLCLTPGPKAKVSGITIMAAPDVVPRAKTHLAREIVVRLIARKVTERTFGLFRYG